MGTKKYVERDEWDGSKTLVEYDDYGELICPHCLDEATHIHLSNSFIQGESVQLEYWCEMCGGVSEMNLEQYKGRTRVYWEPGKRTAKEIFEAQAQ
jgi:hypothetical protein